MMSNYRYNTMDGGKTLLKQGAYYHIQIYEKEVVAQVVGEVHRKAIRRSNGMEISHGQKKWWIEVKTFCRTRPFKNFPTTIIGRSKLQKNGKVTEVSLQDLPKFMWMPYRSAEYEQLLSGQPV